MSGHRIILTVAFTLFLPAATAGRTASLVDDSSIGGTLFLLLYGRYDAGCHDSEIEHDGIIAVSGPLTV